MIETHIYSALSSSQAITDIAGTNIFPLVLPDSPTLPAITYQIISAMARPTFNTSGMTRYRVQIDCWSSQAQGYAAASALRDAVIATLNGYSDQYMTAYLNTYLDRFEQDLLQYRCIAEFFVLSNL